MISTTWLTIFLALVALSILIQTGILIGLYVGTRRAARLGARWEPVLLEKMEPVARWVDMALQTGGRYGLRGLDVMSAYTERIGGLVPIPLDWAAHRLEAWNRRFHRN